MDSAKFARLNARLQGKTDLGEVGQLLSQTSAALVQDSLPLLVHALAGERVLVPAPREDAREPLVAATSPAGPAIVVFTRAEELTKWDSTARPMPLSGQKAALTALASGAPRLWVDPRGVSMVIPRPAVVALAHGDSWLPAWEDPELKAELQGIAQQAPWVAFAGVVVEPGQDSTAVRVVVTVSAGESGQVDQARVAGLLAALGNSPRLQVAAETVEFVPRIVPLV